MINEASKFRLFKSWRDSKTEIRYRLRSKETVSCLMNRKTTQWNCEREILFSYKVPSKKKESDKERTRL